MVAVVRWRRSGATRLVRVSVRIGVGGGRSSGLGSVNSMVVVVSLMAVVAAVVAITVRHAHHQPPPRRTPHAARYNDHPGTHHDTRELPAPMMVS